MIVDGKVIAGEILADLKKRPKIDAFFGAVLVGDDPASLNFLNQKKKVAESLGIDFRLYHLPETTTTDELREKIGELSRVKNCGGFIVQLPLPESVNKNYVLNAIPKEKDVDLLSESAIGAFYTGRHAIMPPSVATVEELTKRENKNLRECKVAVIGAGFLIGKPIGFWFQNRAGEVMMFDSQVKDLYGKLGDADIVVSGAGQPHLFSAQHLKNKALVIDFGFAQVDGKFKGDFDPAGAEEKNITYTKTPGGTGPILVAKLFENFYKLNEAKR